MTPWDQRPVEVRNLFNPAFCGLVMAAGLKAYEQECSEGMPYSLTLLLLPLALHDESRETICANTHTHLLKVADDHPEILVGFAKRARDLVPCAMEAFGLLAQLHCVNISNTGKVNLVPRRISASAQLASDEAERCRQAAKIVGRQFARIFDRATIYATFGVRP